MLATLPGLRFFQQGQFEGKTLHLPMPLNAAADEVPDLDLVHIYEKILVLANHAVFHLGEWRALEVGPDSDTSHDNLLAYQWHFGDAYRLIVINLDAKPAQGRIAITEQIKTASNYQLQDLLTDTHYQRSGDDLRNHGLFVRLDGYNAHIFSITAA